MENKTYFKEGDIVVLKQDLKNKPAMVIEKIEKTNLPGEGSKRLLIGIRTFWFTNDGHMERGRFNFKDLEKKRK